MTKDLLVHGAQSHTSRHLITYEVVIKTAPSGRLRFLVKYHN